MGCGCKKTNVVAPEPTPLPTQIPVEPPKEEPDWYNNLDEYPLIED